MLAPDRTIVQEFLQNFLSAYQSITFSAVSLRNSEFFPLTPAPDWMQTLEDNLGNAQTAAENYLINQGPDIISQIPQFFVTYSNSMNVLAENISSAVTIQDAIQEFTWLKNHIDNIPAAVKVLNASLNSVGATFKPYKDNIDAAIKSALADVKTDQQEVADLSKQINGLLQDIAAETVTAANGMTGVITSGTSLSFALLSWSFAVATEVNPAVPVIGVIVAIGGLTYGAITNAITEAKIESQLEEIKTLGNSLLQENQAIAVLQTLTPMLQSVDTSLAGIGTAMDVSPIWQEESQKVADLITTLQNYSGNDFKTLPDIASLQEAAATWQILSGWAMNIEKSATGISSVGSIDMDQPAQLKAV